MNTTQRLVWVSIGEYEEYQAKVGSVTIHLTPIGGSDRFQVLDSKGGSYFRRDRGTVSGPLENAMEVVERRFLV